MATSRADVCVQFIVFELQTTTLPLSEVPRAIAARDTRGFIKPIRGRDSDRLLGGRIVAPEEASF